MSTTEPLVSVIMTVRNAQEFLNMAIDSILLQSHKNLELIIVDHGSTDDTASIIANYKDIRINFQKVKEQNLTTALNFGISIARGEFIALMGQSDISSPERIKKQSTYLVKNPDVDLVGTNFDVIDENNRIIDRYPEEKSSEYLNPFWLVENSVSGGSFMFVKKKIVELEIHTQNDICDIHGLLKKMDPATKIALLPRIDYQKRVLDIIGDQLKQREIFETILNSETFASWLRLTSKAKVAANDLYTGTTRNLYKQHAISRTIIDAWHNPSLTNNQRYILTELINALNEEWDKPKRTIKAPVVSVVMSIYNGSQFLRPAIESILNQTFDKFEFIIIDDGSKDNSSELVRSYDDDRIRLFFQTNHGFIYSLNKGVSLARGKFIARMDQDDLSLPTRLEEQIKLLEANPKLGAVSTFFELINFKGGDPLGKTMAFPNKDIDIKRAMYLYNPMAHGATIFRKKAWEQAGKYREDYHPPEDYDLWRRIAEKWELAIVPKVLFQYRINNPESMSQKNISRGEDNINRIQHELISGPFIRKSLIRLVLDYRKINRTNYGEHTSQVRQGYLSMQLNIAKVFLDNTSPKRAFTETLFVLLVSPAQSSELIKKYPRCVLRNLKRRLT